MGVNVPRIVIAGLAGDSGKTIVSLGLVTALRHRGLTVAAFKKGPDYIDPAWLSQAAGSVCRNLDTYLVTPEKVAGLFYAHSVGSEISVIEGNRGLHDGRDAVGTHSTAELAKLLGAPVVLVVNAAKATRTVAAIVKGCRDFDPDVNIAGVILNRVAGPRHQNVITEAIRTYCNLPVFGVIPRLGDDSAIIPGRHLGLVPPAEYARKSGYEDKLIDIAREYLDVDGLLAVASSAPDIDDIEVPVSEAKPVSTRIGYFSDSAFTFYYPENLEALAQAGAELVPISSIEDAVLPDIDGLYIGGGFPETHAEKLATNRSLMDAVKLAAEASMPIYAECGGLIYLSRSLTWGDEKHSMASVFPIDLVMSNRPVGHGYASVAVEKSNPFLTVGDAVRGHEFHYSGPSGDLPEIDSCLKVTTGVGIGQKRDGVLYKSTMACYMHLHASGVPSWATNFVASAVAYRADRSNMTGDGDAFDDSTDEVDKRNHPPGQMQSVA